MPNPFSQFAPPETQQQPSTQPEGIVNPFAKFAPPQPEPLQPEPPGAIAQTISNVARPMLETIGGMGGGLVGTGVSPVFGTIAGAGLGLAGAGEVADLLDQALGIQKPKSFGKELYEAGERVVEGAASEAGGQVAAPILSAGVRGALNLGKKFLPSTLRAAEIKAGKLLAEQVSQGSIHAKSAKEAAKLEETIPGLKFTRGAGTADPKVIKFERAQTHVPGGAKELVAEMNASNAKAIQDFMESQKGSGLLDTFNAHIATQQKALEKSAQIAKAKLGAEANSFIPKQTLEAGGEGLRTIAREGEIAAREASSALFKAVPKTKLPGKPIAQAVEDISAKVGAFEDVGSNIPTLFGRVKKVLKPIIKQTQAKYDPALGKVVAKKISRIPKVKLNDVQGLRSEVLAEISMAKATLPINRRLISRLNELRNSLDVMIDSAGASSAPLRTANQHFKTEVINKFNSGTVSDILAVGKNRLNKIESANVASTFFKPRSSGVRAADDFLNAVGGNPKALEAISDYAGQDMLHAATNPLTGEIVPAKLSAWISKYSKALDKFGLKNKFSSLEAQQAVLDKALESKAMFEKSMVAKIFKSDPANLISKAFATGGKAEIAKELVRTAGGNKIALDGLRNSTIDHIIAKAGKMRGKAHLNTGKVLDEFAPALKVLFKETPEKLDALNKVRRAVRTIARGDQVGLGDGYKEAETLVTELTKRLGLSGSRVFNIIRAFTLTVHKMEASQVKAFLNRAVVDPDFAYSLLFAAKGGSEDIVEKRLLGHMIGIGLRNTYKEVKESDIQFGEPSYLDSP